MVKHINVGFENADYAKLLLKKGGKSWEKFILELIKETK